MALVSSFKNKCIDDASATLPTPMTLIPETSFTASIHTFGITLIDKEQIAVNEEVKQKVTESKEPDKVNEYTGVYNIAFFGVDARDENLGKG